MTDSSPLNSFCGNFLPLFYARSNDDMGIGDIGSLYKAVELANRLNHQVIEILPLNISSAFESPYSVLSAFLIDWQYISVPRYLDQYESPSGLIELQDHEAEICQLRQSKTVAYLEVRKIKLSILKACFHDFRERKETDAMASLEAFKEHHKEWLQDHILYMLLREKFTKENPERGWDFRTWPESLRLRDPIAIGEAYTEFNESIEFHIYLQWIVNTQWHELTEHAAGKKVSFMGDTPYAVDGADIWLHPEIFTLKPIHFKREFTQGVPPDYFSPFGQYWQFYAYDFEHPDTLAFLMERLAWHQKMFKVLRLDHVLGYYRGYHFFEDPDNVMTLEKLGLWDSIQEIVIEGKANPQKQGELGWEAYRLFLFTLARYEGVQGDNFRRFFFDEHKPWLLQEEAMLLMAREATGELDETFGIRQYTVEKAIQDQWPVWDYIKLSVKDGYQFHPAMQYYLFNDAHGGPKPGDSLRPCFFRKAPGEALMKKFLEQGENQGTTLICEALGIVPDFVVDSLEKIQAPNYIPLIFGLTPENPENPYMPANHPANAFVTFALHDSETIYAWWENQSSEDKQKLLNFLFGPDNEMAWYHPHLNEKIQKAILGQVMKSPARMKMLLWTDIFGSADDQAINQPGTQTAQWISRMPADATLDDLLEAAQDKPSTFKARRAVRILRDLNALL